MSAEDTTIIGTQERTQLCTLLSFLSLTAMLFLSEKVLLSRTDFSFSNLTPCILFYLFYFILFFIFSFFM